MLASLRWALLARPVTQRRRPSVHCSAASTPAAGAPAGEADELLLAVPGRAKRQKVSMMSLGCPKNVVDGERLAALRHRATSSPPNSAGEVILGDLFREGFDITVRGALAAPARRGGRAARPAHPPRPLQTSHEEADAIVVNTCAFIDEVRARETSQRPRPSLRARRRQSRSRLPQSSRRRATRRTARRAASS